MSTDETQDGSDPMVVVHVETSDRSCGTCGSSNVLTVRMGEEDSPVWVQVCSECDERVWSLDDQRSSD